MGTKCPYNARITVFNINSCIAWTSQATDIHLTSFAGSLLRLIYKLSYRGIEEVLAERGCFVDRSTINRWVINFVPMIESKARQIKRPASPSWLMDETYIKIKGEWWYFYRAVDKFDDDC